VPAPVPAAENKEEPAPVPAPATALMPVTEKKGEVAPVSVPVTPDVEAKEESSSAPTAKARKSTFGKMKSMLSPKKTPVASSEAVDPTMSVEKALDMIQDPKCDSNQFMLFGYDSKMKGFEVKVGPLSGGMASLKSAIGCKKELLYGIFRVVGRDGSKSATCLDSNHFVTVFYRPSGLPIKMRMKATNFKSAAQKVVGNVAFNLEIDVAEELSEDDIVASLRKCGGARQPTDFLFA